MKLRYFKISDFDQKDGKLPGSGENMDKDFLLKLDELRHRCGFPFIITSGYRSPEYNAKVSKTGKTGPHTTGRAADVHCLSGAHRYTIVKHAIDLGFTGIGIHATFVHVDTIPRQALWLY